MISERQIDLLIERFVNRIEQANSYYLQKLGESVKKIRTLTPTQAQQLVQILKYNGDYEEIVARISKLTNLDIKEIDELFSEFAKKDQLFYEKFYKYKDVPFVEYAQNEALKRQTQALSNIAKQEMYNFARSNALGYSIRDLKGRVQFIGLRETYERVLDEAVLNVGTGIDTFDNAMSIIMKEIGGSGLKTLDYNGRSIRLDSMVRQHLKGALRQLHNENQKLIGEDIDFDGYEISTHLNPAIDHEKIQGHQFSIEEYEKLNKGDEAKDYTGKTFTLDHDHKNGFRPISTLNCYHYVFSIILGVSKPEYSKEELQEIIDNNNKGFELDGEHYTNYEGTQMQRKLETEIRKQKDIQIIAKASGNKELVQESQSKITQLTRKYKQLSDVSGLPTKMERMRVSGYKRVKVDIPKMNNYKEIEYARKNNTIWHSTESLEEIMNDDKIITPSIAVGKEMNTKIKYGTQFIEFKPEILENVNKKTALYNGDGGNQFSNKASKFDNLMQMLKDKPKNYNELKFNNDLESLKYIKKVYIRQDEPKELIKLLRDNNIEYEIYEDYRIRGFKKKK